MRYALIVGVLVCGSFAYAGEEPESVLKEEPTVATTSDCDCNNCKCDSCKCGLFRMPRKIITRTRTVTTADACGNCESNESTVTRTRGRLFPIFGRRVVRSCSTCSSCN